MGTSREPSTGATSAEPDLSRRLLEGALRIRTVEQLLLDLYKGGEVAGTVHSCVGQELIAVALAEHMTPGRDAFFGTHRGHGHYLAQGGSAEALLAELTGREGAACLGRGGSQHLQFDRFFATGIQAEGAVIAVGFAEMQKRTDPGAITVSQIGDGTLGEGALYEAFTFAALLRAPILFLLEHNGWAQSTDTSTTIRGDILRRAEGFGLTVGRCSDQDPERLWTDLGAAVDRVRSGEPSLQVVDTRRLLAHGASDDIRPEELRRRQWEADPLHQELEASQEWKAREEEVRSELEGVGEEVLSRPRLSLSADSPTPPIDEPPPGDQLRARADAEGTVVSGLNGGLHRLLADLPEALVIGEDLLDPYGGAFKVTAGLSSAYPDRVLSTPIAEAGITGVSNGMALGGMRPIAELMFGDFLMLAMDQLINMSAKAHYIFGGRVTCPLTVRLVTGGGRGYGPTHSQSPERMLCGEPGLRVLALSRRHDPGSLLEHAVRDDAPTVFVESKELYPHAPLHDPPLGLEFASLDGTADSYPHLLFRPPGDDPSATVVTYGSTSDAVETALFDQLIEREVLCDYFIATQLWPLDVSAIVESVRRTRRLVVVEPHVADFGFGAAVAAAVAQQVGADCSYRLVGARPVPIPAASDLEGAVLTRSEDVTEALRGLIA